MSIHHLRDSFFSAPSSHTKWLSCSSSSSSWSTTRRQQQKESASEAKRCTREWRMGVGVRRTRVRMPFVHRPEHIKPPSPPPLLPPLPFPPFLLLFFYYYLFLNEGLFLSVCIVDKATNCFRIGCFLFKDYRTALSLSLSLDV